mgnify:CR=1 FL=1
MKIFSFVQPNFQQGPKEFNAHYLPYSAGVLWSYVNSFPVINNYYKLGKFIWKRDDIQQTIEQLLTSDIVGFSTYVWNKNYNYTLAKKLKKVKPDVKIIFGGPEPPISRNNFFQIFPFIDIMIKQEGEYTLRKVLECLDSEEKLLSIPGLLINKSGTVFDTGSATRIKDLKLIPSPYLSGLFDEIMFDNKDIEWNATLETDRGCPYQCTFCDWGSLTYNKIKKFELDRVFDELEWIGKNKCGFLSITNANFGIFPERDNLIADKIIEVQNKYGYPYTFSVAWAKNQKQEVVDIVKKLLNSPGFNQGLTVSVQSLDFNVLENIKRQNLESSKIEEIFDLCDKSNIPIYTEIILGLPGETINTWKENFWKLFRSGNHTGVTIFQAQMLENAEMNLSQRKAFQIESQIVYDYMSGSYNEDVLKEGIEIIISTKDMPYETMLDAEVFSWYINTFHINGVSTFLSRFVYKFLKIDYGVFYEKLLSFLKQDNWFCKEMAEIRMYYDNWMSKGQIDHNNIGNVEIHGWNLIHRTVINIHFQNKYNHVFSLLYKFMEETFCLDNNILDELFTFQKNYLISYKNIKKLPKKIFFQYDFLNYVQETGELNNPVTYEFDFNEDKDMSLTRFCENLYFYRRRNFGKAWVSKI